MKTNRRTAIKQIAASGILLSMNPFGVLNSCKMTKRESKFFRYSLNPSFPRFDFLSVDSLGKSKLQHSPLNLNEVIGQRYRSQTQGETTSYYLEENDKQVAWQFVLTKKGFILRSYYVEGNVSWDINVNKDKNHATVLGIIPEKNKVKTPCILHFPDMGSFKLRSEQIKLLDYTSARFDVPVPFIQVSLPPACEDHKMVEYSFEIDAIYPKLDRLKNDARFDGYRRCYINAFQVNPNIKQLANNSTSDSCAFVQYGYSEVALETPELVDGLQAIDLIGMTIDSYLSGTKGYGILGYPTGAHAGGEVTVWGGQNASLDSYPSLLIAACNYYIGTKNHKWLENNYKGLEDWANEIITRDGDNDGLIEYGYSGNSGSWTGDHSRRPANWWDTIGFGHKDAYSNALAYRAMIKFAEISIEVGESTKAKQYEEFAEKLKSNYYSTFINPETGVLAGWKSEDGELHDYYFTFVNAIAIAFDLVNEEQANKIMDNILNKIDEVGFTNFELGLPGNLLPIKHSDYVHHDTRWGGSSSDEVDDGWQHYENGGTSGNYVYFTLKALFQLGRIEDAEKILFPLLKGFEEGNFQGMCDNGMTKDWRTWDGECWGYEGFLVDNYWSVLAVTEYYQ